MPPVHGLWSFAVVSLVMAGSPLGPDLLQAQAGAKGDPKLTPELLAVRTALDKYRDPVLAVHDGYFSTLACLEFSKGSTGHGDMDYQPGAMGIHFLNPAAIGPKLDPMKPQVLLYEQVGDKLQLTGAEWFMPTQVSKMPPTIFGQKLQGPMEGHEPVLPQALHHWDLHVWLWKSNPNGLFSPTNAAVKCPKGPYTIDEMPPKMVTP